MQTRAGQRLLNRLADLMEANADELAAADSRDMGKPLNLCHHDVARAALHSGFFADHAKMATAESFTMDTGHHAYSSFEPASVVFAIAPWNFPLMLESWKVAPALAWGNTVALKPAEDAPASATVMARLATEAGLPDGVFNVVHGYGADLVGSELTEDPRVDRITFTGETGTGKIISRAASANLTPVSLELGGKNCNLVFADADLENAVH
nr:aldehyde dehydrogenase family protein [Nocardioides luti]